jgi:hypothetical protein
MLDPLVAAHALYWLTATFLLVRHLYCKLLSVDANAAYWHAGAVVRLVEVGFATFVPVRYMIWPPTIGQTDETLVGNSHESGGENRRYWMRREGPVLAWQDIAEIVVIIAYDWL